MSPNIVYSLASFSSFGATTLWSPYFFAVNPAKLPKIIVLKIAVLLLIVFTNLVAQFTNHLIQSIMAKTAKKAAPKKAAKKAAAPKKAAAAPAKKAAAPKKAAKRTPNAAFMAAHNVSPELAAVVGSKPLSRPDITKKIWDYIKKHGLQDKTNKRMINADDKLKAVFGKDQVSMFDLAKIVSANIK